MSLNTSQVRSAPTKTRQTNKNKNPEEKKHSKPENRSPTAGLPTENKRRRENYADSSSSLILLRASAAAALRARAFVDPMPILKEAHI